MRDPQDVAWRFRRKDGIPTESTVRLSRIGTVVVGFLAGHPETSVDLRTGDVMIDLVREGFDLAIMPTSPPDSTLVKRRLAVWRYVVCAAPAYLEKHAPPQSPADLKAHNCLFYIHSVFGHDWPFLDSDNNRMMVRVTGNLATTSIVVMRAAVRAGLGLWLCPTYIVLRLACLGTTGASAEGPSEPGDGERRALSAPSLHDRQGARLHRHAGRKVCRRAALA